MKFWNDVRNAIRNSDIVIEVIDARMPELTRNHEIERMVGDKKLIFAINKSDLIPKDSAEKIKNKLGVNDALFVSGKKNLGMSVLKKKIMMEAKRMGIDEPRVSFVGYPNVGKSSIINALAKRAKAMTSVKPGTTRGIQWIKAGSIRVLDSPGVIPIEDKDIIRLVLIGAKSASKVKEPYKIVYRIIDMFKETNVEAFESFYGVKIEGRENDEIIEDIGKKKGYLLKGGIVDENRAYTAIINDWREGKLSS